MQQELFPGSFGPMAGVRVLDVGTMIAAPFGASLLADFGAEVIKVELPGVGDASRNLMPRLNGESLRWAVFSRNKQCITLDLRKEKGRELFLRLVERADIIMENFRPGTLDRWGLDYGTLREANSRVVVVRISGYGQTGPNREMAGFGTPATAYSGVTYISGYPDRPPVSPPFSLADYVAGMTAALAAVMAIYNRDTRGEDGQEVDVSLYEPLFRMLEGVVAEYDKLGVVRERKSGTPGDARPSGTYRTRDGRWVVLVCSTENTWRRLPPAMGMPELLEDERFRTNADRVRHGEALDKIVAGWFASHDYAEVKRRLDEAGCPVSPVNSIADIFDDPHYRARESIIEVDHPRWGTVKMPGIVPKFSRTPGRVLFAGPDLGAHNDRVYRDLLGLDGESLAALREDGVI